MRWEAQVARIGEKRNACRILLGKQEGKRPLIDLDLGWKFILKWILEKYDGTVWTGLVWFRIGTSESSFEHGNVHSGSIKCREVPE
jgi:hypothetical protein